MRDRQVLIVGSGRSGSNRMLDILDTHPYTHCRSEANKIKRGVLSKLGSGLTPDEVPPDFAQKWKIATDEIRLKLSYRDRIANQPKAFVKNWARVTIGNQIFRRNRLRNTVGLLYPTVYGEEWSLPRWYLNNIEDNYPLHVFKILGNPYWFKALAESELDLMFIHNLRDPRHYIASWYNRYLSRQEPETVHQLNMQILTNIKKQDDYWAERIMAPNDMSLLESQVMLWVHWNETIFCNGINSDKYTYVTYEEIEDNGAQTAERVFKFLDLDFDSGIADKVHNMRNTLFKKTKSLDKDTLLKINQAVEKYLPSSPLAEFWAR